MKDLQEINSSKQEFSKKGLATAGCVLAAASFFEFSQGIQSAISTVKCKSDIVSASVYFDSAPEPKELATAEQAKAELASIHGREFQEFGLSAILSVSALFCLSKAYFPKRDNIDS